MKQSIFSIGYLVLSLIPIWRKSQPESPLWSIFGPSEHLSLIVRSWKRMGEYLDGKFRCSWSDALALSGHALIWGVGAVLVCRVVNQWGTGASRSAILILVSYWLVVSLLNVGLVAIRSV